MRGRCGCAGVRCHRKYECNAENSFIIRSGYSNIPGACYLNFGLRVRSLAGRGEGRISGGSEGKRLTRSADK